MSIVDPKYRDKYKEKPLDFVDKLIADQCSSIEKAGKDGSKEITVLNPSLVLDLAAANAVDAERVKHFRSQIGQKNAAGRIRMTVANMLRARALRRHGLNTIDGTFKKADKDFIGEAEKTEHPDGTPLVDKKAIREAEKAKRAEEKAKADAEKQKAKEKAAAEKAKAKEAADKQKAKEKAAAEKAKKAA